MGCADGSCATGPATTTTTTQGVPAKIAVLLDDQGLAATPEQGGTLFLFERSQDEWAAFHKREFCTAGYDTMDGLRDYLAEACEWLADCRVMAAVPSRGFYQVVMETLGVALWPVVGSPETLFAQVERFCAQEPQNAAVEPQEPPAQILAVAGKAGHYEVDMRGAMGGAGRHGSRQVLMPFFRDVTFRRLDITCDHVPKWFAQELPALGLHADSQSEPTYAVVHVYPIG